MLKLRLAVITVACALALTPVTSQADEAILDQLQVVDSRGSAAALGTVIRLPAEDPGGAHLSFTRLDKDKAFGRSAGFYPGSLMTTYLQTSADAYTNPTVAEAQDPPGGAFPRESSATGRAEVPGKRGEAGSFTAKALSRTEVVARAAGAVSSLDVPVHIEAASTYSTSRVEEDGTTITDTHAELKRVRVGDVLIIQQVRSVAMTRVPKVGIATGSSSTTLAGMLLNGVPASLSERGLVISDRTPLSPAQIAAFNEGLAALDRQGLFVLAVPTLRHEEKGRAVASAAALRLRYRPEGGGGFEVELLLGQAYAQGVSVPYESPALDGTPDTPVDVSPFGELIGPPASAPSNRGDAERASAGAAVDHPVAIGREPALLAAPGIQHDRDDEDFLLAARPLASSPARVRTGYGLIVLVAFVASASFVALRRPAMKQPPR